MVISTKIFKGLIQRFFFIYLLVVLLPTLLLGNLLYSNDLKQVRSELINAKKESLMSDKYYLENQMEHIKDKYNQFKVSTALSDILEHGVNTPKNIMYLYIKDVSPVLISNKGNNSYIKQIRIYTSNETAEKVIPEFLPISELYQMNISKKFSDDPQKELFRQFWQVQSLNGELELIFYAGLMNSIYSKISGVLSITCNSKLFDLFLNEQHANTATYIYWNKQLIHSFQDNSEMHEFLTANEESILNSYNDIDVILHSSTNILQSSIRLSDQGIEIVQLSRLTSKSLMASAFSSSLLLCIFLFILSNVVLFPLLYRPLRNASLLARHMSQTRSPVLVPYSGPVSNDEIGNLIKEYNSMVERTNTMSYTISKNELLLRNAQIETLQSQLNPHFFYGTLENIRMIAEAHHETLIANIAYSFGNLMRYSLSREYFVPILTEIDIVKQYLEIQTERLGNRFSVNWNLEISTDEWICPKFVLFSMVENVFVHDISKTRQQVHIDIDIIQEEADLSITVTNDGPGIPPERLSKIQYLKDHLEERSTMSSQNNGRSVFNINDRLQLYYGSDYKFTITSEENIRTVCNVRFNIKLNEPQKLKEADYGGEISC